MAMSRLILARPDAACGRVFHDNRRHADQHRIALEVWNRATGRAKENRRLVVFHCKRCGGFHIGTKTIDRLRPCDDSRTRAHEINPEALLLKHVEDRTRSKLGANEVWRMKPRREP